MYIYNNLILIFDNILLIQFPSEKYPTSCQAILHMDANNIVVSIP